MGRSVSNWACVFALVALPVGGCSEETTATGGTGDAGGSGGSAGSGGRGGMPECESPDDCDDSNDCTVGTCAGGACDSTPVADDTACGDGAGTCQQGSCRVACDEQGIRDAIAAGGGPFTFDCDGPTTVVTEATIVIDNDVILDGQSNLTLDGDEDHQVFFVDDGVTAELRRWTVTRGSATWPNEGGGIGNDGALMLVDSVVTRSVAKQGGDCGDGDPCPGFGGGIANGGTMMLVNAVISENAVDSGSSVGGGISNRGVLMVVDSTISRNSAFFSGAILTEGMLTLTNSTVSNNMGMGILCGPDSTLTLTNSTVSGNGLHGFLCGGNATLTLTNSTVSGNSGSGIVSTGDSTLTLTDSTVSENGRAIQVYAQAAVSVAGAVIDGDCDGPVSSKGYNIESPGNTCGFDQEGDQTNVTAGNLKLEPLADNGGPTMTHALLPGSVAIDVIPEAVCELDEDQRGVTRPQGDACDVGAFEAEE